MSSAKGARKAIAVMLSLMVALSTMALGGCAGETGSRDILKTPAVSSPAIATDGVLRVGVDSSNAPYSGMAGNELVGIDVDVAAAIADQLGLRLELVDIKGQTADTMLAEGAIDMVMDMEQTGGSVMRALKVGPYLESGPALFTIVRSQDVPQIDLTTLAGTKISAQKDSLSAWSLEELIGTGTADPRDNLEAAFRALSSGEVTYSAADAVVGSYLALEFDDISCVKILGTPIGIYIGVAETNATLADALTQALRTIRDNGILKTVVAKWLGNVSASVVIGSSAVTSQSTGSGAPELPEGQIDTGEDLPDPANAGTPEG